MKYLNKGYVFDEEVTAWLNKLKLMHGSYNKGLRLVAFPTEGRGHPAIDVAAKSKLELTSRPRRGLRGKEGKAR